MEYSFPQLLINLPQNFIGILWGKQSKAEGTCFLCIVNNATFSVVVGWIHFIYLKTWIRIITSISLADTLQMPQLIDLFPVPCY